MSARSEILDAIRNAGVPAAPPAAEVPRNLDDGPLLDRFLAALALVGAGYVRRESGQSLHEVVTLLTRTGRSSMVIRSQFAVAENGAVYVDAADLGDRADVVRAEHLIVVVAATAIVPTMHEAMVLIPRTSTCGWFLSGPSKTADIEQALVVGAQGARTLDVVVE